MRVSLFPCLLLLTALTASGIFLHHDRFPSEKIVSDGGLAETEINIPGTADSPKAPVLHAAGACVMDTASGRILYGKAANKKAAMASTTKIMTALLVLESGKQKETATASAKAATMPKVHLGMKAGEQFLIEDLLYSLMLESHNDTAVVLAEHIGGSLEEFADMMNQKAKELHMTSTHFVTPNGLDAKSHYSTPADMCRLASYAVRNSDFCELVQTKSHTFQNVNKTHTYSLTNRDAFLSYYEGALGIKTGFTGNAGYCFVGAARRGDTVLASCVLASGWPPNKTYKWTDTKALMDYGFEHFHPVTLPLQNLSSVSVLVEDGKKDFVFLRQPDSVSTLTGDFETMKIVYEIPDTLCAPVRKDVPIGSVRYYIDGKIYHTTSIFPLESIEKSDFSDTIKGVLNLWMESFCAE